MTNQGKIVLVSNHPSNKPYHLFFRLVYNRPKHEVCVYRFDCPKEELDSPVSFNGAVELVKCILTSTKGMEHWNRLDFERYVLSVIDGSLPGSGKPIDELVRIDVDMVEEKYIISNPKINVEGYGEIPLNRAAVAIPKFALTCEEDGWNERHPR